MMGIISDFQGCNNTTPSCYFQGKKEKITSKFIIWAIVVIFKESLNKPYLFEEESRKT